MFSNTALVIDHFKTVIEILIRKCELWHVQLKQINMTIIKIGTPKTITEFEHFDFIIHVHLCVQMVQINLQTAWTLIRLLFLEQSDLGPRCLPRLICPSSKNCYGISNPNQVIL